jgi:hypothetical protein
MADDLKPIKRAEFAPGWLEEELNAATAEAATWPQAWRDAIAAWNRRHHG